MFDSLQNFNRFQYLPSGWVRKICEHLYGKKISKDAWQRWKLWAQIPEGRTSKIHLDNIYSLMAISLLRRKEQFVELNEKDIDSLIPRMKELLDSQLQVLEAGVFGRDLPDWFSENYQKQVSLRTLYRIVPQFSASNLYNPFTVLDRIGITHS